MFANKWKKRSERKNRNERKRPFCVNLPARKNRIYNPNSYHQLNKIENYEKLNEFRAIDTDAMSFLQVQNQFAISLFRLYGIV